IVEGVLLGGAVQRDQQHTFFVERAQHRIGHGSSSAAADDSGASSSGRATFAAPPPNPAPGERDDGTIQPVLRRSYGLSASGLPPTARRSARVPAGQLPVLGAV